jgi:hypothetical protein
MRDARRVGKVIGPVAAALLGVAVLSSCAHRDRHDSRPADPAVGDGGGKRTAATAPGKAPEKLGAHWVQNTQLRALMKEMSERSQAHAPRNLPQDPEDPASKSPDAAFKQAAMLADALAGAAVRIPASISNVQMADADRRAFEAEATMLRDQAYTLRQHANAKRLEQMQRSLDAINSTCISCHSRFRDFAGQLDVQRVTADDTGNRLLAPLVARGR